LSLIVVLVILLHGDLRAQQHRIQQGDISSTMALAIFGPLSCCR